MVHIVIIRYSFSFFVRERQKQKELLVNGEEWSED